MRSLFRVFFRLALFFYVLNMLFVGSADWIHNKLVRNEAAILSVFPAGIARTAMHNNLKILILTSESGVQLQKMTGLRISGLL